MRGRRASRSTGGSVGIRVGRATAPDPKGGGRASKRRRRPLAGLPCPVRQSVMMRRHWRIAGRSTAGRR